MDRTWDLDVILLENDGFTSDEIGNQIARYKEHPLMAYEDNVSRNEFYQSGQAGIEKIRLFIIHPYEYSGENYLQMGKEKYQIIRVFQRNYEELEVVCRVNLGDKVG